MSLLPTNYKLLANESVSLKITSEKLSDIRAWSDSQWKTLFVAICECPVGEELEIVIGTSKIVIRKKMRLRKKPA